MLLLQVPKSFIFLIYISFFTLKASAQPDQIIIHEDIVMEPFSYSEVKESVAYPSKSPGFITASDGIRLAYYAFNAKQEQSVLVFYHGGGIWSNGLYQTMAQQSCEQQTTVYTRRLS